MCRYAFFRIWGFKLKVPLPLGDYKEQHGGYSGATYVAPEVVLEYITKSSSRPESQSKTILQLRKEDNSENKKQIMNRAMKMGVP